MLATENDLLNGSIQGWSVLSNIERSNGAMVMRDPIARVIRGVRYQILSHKDQQSQAQTHDFSFEGWCYKARGPIEHRSFLKFKLKDRFTFGLTICDYLSDLRILNKPLDTSEKNCFAVLKASAEIINAINTNDHLDISALLKKYGLIESGIFFDSVLKQDMLIDSDMSQS